MNHSGGQSQHSVLAFLPLGGRVSFFFTASIRPSGPSTSKDSPSSSRRERPCADSCTTAPYSCMASTAHVCTARAFTHSAVSSDPEFYFLI